MSIDIEPGSEADRLIFEIAEAISAEWRKRPMPAANAMAQAVVIGLMIWEKSKR